MSDLLDFEGRGRPVCDDWLGSLFCEMSDERVDVKARFEEEGVEAVCCFVGFWP
jgi:hypothetical protein